MTLEIRYKPNHTRDAVDWVKDRSGYTVSRCFLHPRTWARFRKETGIREDWAPTYRNIGFYPDIYAHPAYMYFQ